MKHLLSIEAMDTASIKTILENAPSSRRSAATANTNRSPARRGR